MWSVFRTFRQRRYPGTDNGYSPVDPDTRHFHTSMNLSTDLEKVPYIVNTRYRIVQDVNERIFIYLFILFYLFFWGGWVHDSAM